jgi:predicted transcriptional regulator
MERLCDLLFELSNTERMRIMLILREQRLKLSHVSQKLDMTVTEASRHLQRLSNVKLISKDANGTFGTTMFGELAVSLLSSLQYISDNREYFLDHDVFNIPYEFTNRLGELSSSSFEMDAVKVLDHCFLMLQDAEEFIWTQSYQILPSHVPILENQIKKGVDFRGIFPEGLSIPSAIASHIRSTQSIEQRILVTDKEAMTGFTHMNRTPHYAAFFSEDSKFMKWCRDVHLYYWGLAKSA